MRAQSWGEERDEQRIQYLRAIFDGFPVPAFVVDDDVNIHDFNTAAEALLGPEPATALFRRGGEALHCIHSEMHGCGKAEPCQDCVIRNSVRKAISTQATLREFHPAKLRTSTGVANIELLVTTHLLPYTEEPRVLVILEEAGGKLTAGHKCR
jgi:PAS domain-containing protein